MLGTEIKHISNPSWMEDAGRQKEKCIIPACHYLVYKPLLQQRRLQMTTRFILVWNAYHSRLEVLEVLEVLTGRSRRARGHLLPKVPL
jgi:hypothetical protein